MAGRGTDIILGGNPEFEAKREMKAKAFTDEQISFATSFVASDDPELLHAREMFKELLEKYKEERADEQAQVRALGGLCIIGTERHESRRIDNQPVSYTHLNYFRMYNKLAGMTGTAKTEEDEFRDIYNMDVVVIPTNKPVIREDLDDAIFAKEPAKFHAIVERIAEVHETGQPVLVGTISIEISEKLSAMLKKRGIKHNAVSYTHLDVYKRQEHKHIDWKIGYFPFSLYIGVREDDCACEMIILILQYLDEGRVFLIILTAFDLDRQDSTIMFDNKI